MSHCQGDAVWGAPSCAGQWTLPLCSVVQYQDISTACNTTVSGLRSIWALDSCWIPLLSGDCVSPDPVFLFFFPGVVTASLPHHEDGSHPVSLCSSLPWAGASVSVHILTHVLMPAGQPWEKLVLSLPDSEGCCYNQEEWNLWFSQCPTLLSFWEVSKLLSVPWL